MIAASAVPAICPTTPAQPPRLLDFLQQVDAGPQGPAPQSDRTGEFVLIADHPVDNSRGSRIRGSANIIHIY